MTKILYLVLDEFEEKPIQQIAEEQGVEVEVFRVIPNPDEEVLRDYIRQWRKIQPDLILCRGRWELRIKNRVDFAYVLGIKFSSETTMAILNSYRNKHPGFFEQAQRKVLLVSTKRLPLNIALFEEMFHVKITNLPLVESQPADEIINERMSSGVIELMRGYDLVVVGKNHVKQLWENGINAYYKENSEEETLRDNLLIADILVKSRKELQEKNNVIQNILDNSFNAILTLSRDGRIIRGNGLVKRYFKEELPDIVGKSVYEFIPDLNRELIERMFVEESGFYGEVVQFNEQILVMNGFPIFSGGVIVSAALYFEELRQIERMEQKVKSELYTKGRIAKYHFYDILGESESMKQTKEYAREFARHTSNILLYGESGTGKELFAQSIHNRSSCKNGPFVAVNCGAFPSSLLESELFGYVGGAFTGASKNGKKGLIEQAHKGTLFLDEISEMEPMGQVRLLRVLEEKSVIRIGDDKVIPVDVRIIAASNKNLKKLVEQGKFREDLYYRLNVLMLKVPPLRERKGDIRMLAEHYIQHFGDLNKKYIELSEDAVQALERYSWSGNVRQLRNFCERLVIISMKRVVDGPFVVRQLNDSFFETMEEESLKNERITEEKPENQENKKPDAKPVKRAERPAGAQTEEKRKADAENRMGGKSETGYAEAASGAEAGTERGTEAGGQTAQQPEAEQILKALNAAGGNRGEAAQMLGISKTSLWRKMKKYNIFEKY